MSKTCLPPRPQPNPTDEQTGPTANSNENSFCLTNNVKWLLKCMPVDFDPTVTTTTATTINITPQGAAQLSVYFQDTNYDLILKKFSNRYVISEIQKQMIHLECFYNYFIERHLLRSMMAMQVLSQPLRNNSSLVHRSNQSASTAESSALNSSIKANLGYTQSFKPIVRVFSLNCRLIGYMCSLLGAISSAYSINKIQPTSGGATAADDSVSTASGSSEPAEGKSLAALFKNDILIAPKNFQSNLNIKLNRMFLHQTCILPNKLLMLISNYRLNYPVRYVYKSDNVTLERVEVIADDPNYKLDDSDNQVRFAYN